MKYNKVSGLDMSEITLGTVQLGMNYGIANNNGQPDRSVSFKMLNAALGNGVNSLDTARFYGESEDVLGEFFKSHNESGRLPLITTKVKSKLPDGSSPADVEKELFTSIETSLSKLGVKKVNCVLLHSAADMTRHGDIVPRTLEAFIKKGYTDIVGVSVYQPDEADTMLENDLYSAIQLPMNLFDLKFITTGAIDRLKAHNVGIFVRSVFFQGLFFLDPDKVTDPLLAEAAVPAIRRLRALSQSEGMSIAEIAMTYIRDTEGVTSLVLGSDTDAQVLENIACISVPRMSEAGRRVIEETFASIDIPKIMTVLTRPKPKNQ